MSPTTRDSLARLQMTVLKQPLIFSEIFLIFGLYLASRRNICYASLTYGGEADGQWCCVSRGFNWIGRAPNCVGPMAKSLNCGRKRLACWFCLPPTQGGS